MRKNIFLILLLLISVFSISVYETHTITTKKQSVQMQTVDNPIGEINLYATVDKRNEDGDFLSGAKFKIFTNNKTESDTLRENNDYYYRYYYSEFYESGEEYFDTAYNTLSPQQKNLVDSIDSSKDLKQIDGGKYIDCTYYSTSEGANGEINAQGSMPDGYYCNVALPTYMLLEETKAPAGYAKDKTLLPGIVVLTYRLINYLPPVGTAENIAEQSNYSYYFNSSEDVELQLAKVSVLNLYSAYSMKYGVVDLNSLVGTSLDEAWDIWEDHLDVGEECYYSVSSENFMAYCFEDYSYYVFGAYESAKINSHGIKVPDDLICDAAYVVNHEGTPTLTATSTVNNVESITTSVNKNLEYKIVVKNTGDVDSIDNTIRTTVPKEFVYVNGTASDDGSYADGVIVWSVPRIAAGEEVTLTFTAYAPNGVDPKQEYIGKTTVDSFSIEDRVTANDTKVKLSLTNPSTKTPLYIFVLILFVTVVGSIVLIQQYKSTKQQAQG